MRPGQLTVCVVAIAISVGGASAQRPAASQPAAAPNWEVTPRATPAPASRPLKLATSTAALPYNDFATDSHLTLEVHHADATCDRYPTKRCIDPAHWSYTFRRKDYDHTRTGMQGLTDAVAAAADSSRRVKGDRKQPSERRILLVVDAEAPYSQLQGATEVCAGSGLWNISWKVTSPGHPTAIGALDCPLPVRQGSGEKDAPRDEIRVLMSYSLAENRLLRLFGMNAIPEGAAGDNQLARLITDKHSSFVNYGIDAPVIIDTGGHVPFQYVVDVVTMCRDAKIARVELGFGTQVDDKGQRRPPITPTPVAGRTTAQSPAKTPRELAERISKGVAAGSAEVLKAALDVESVIDFVTKGAAETTGYKDAWIAGARRGELFASFDAIPRAVSNGGSYTFLRIGERAKEPTLLFRLIGADGLNYHEYRIGSDRDGQLSIKDVFLLSTGETLSEGIRARYVRQVAETNAELVLKNAGKDVPRPQDRITSVIDSVQDALGAGKFAEALTSLATLPKDVQATRSCLIAKATAEARLHSPAYETTCHEFERLFPGDRALDLVSIDWLLLAKKFDAVDAALTRIESRVGGDAYLGTIRGAVFLQQEKLEQSKACYRRAVTAEPTLLNAHWGLVTIALKQKDWAETVRVLSHLETKLNWKFPDLTKVPLYADFVKTDEYKRWMESRKAK